MPHIELKGIFPPISTPFIGGRVAYDKLTENVKKWGKTGIRGYVVLGSNGEYVFLSEEEKRNVVETVTAASPDDKLIIAGTGCESTEETLRLTHDAAERGAHAALVVTPHYFGGGMRQEVLINHYTRIADRSPIPIILYSVPKFTHITLLAETVSVLSKHPNIAGIKESSGNVNLLGEFVNQADKDFNVLCGTAGTLLGALTIGCVGGIAALANIAPNECVEIMDLVDQEDFEGARELQLRMLPVNNAVTATYGIAGLKAAMDMRGYFGGDPRLPLLPLNDEKKSDLEGILKQAKLLK